jgi:hypothetical protein
MKNYLNVIIVLLLSLTLTSCEIIGTIFKGGVWTGAILVVLVIGIIIWGFTSMFGGGSKNT